jgi:hypothetical protein
MPIIHCRAFHPVSSTRCVHHTAKPNLANLVWSQVEVCAADDFGWCTSRHFPKYFRRASEGWDLGLELQGIDWLLSIFRVGAIRRHVADYFEKYRPKKFWGEPANWAW